MRRRQKEKWKKMLVIVCGTMILIFGLRALSSLIGMLWNLIPKQSQIAGQIGEGLLLEDRTLFSYLRFHEDERGPFRFISEQVLGHNRYAIASSKESKYGDEMEDNGKTDGILNSPDKEKTMEKETEDKDIDKEKEVQEKEGKMDWAGEEGKQFSASVTESLLESVMSETAAYGRYLPVSYAKGDVLPAATLPQVEEIESTKSFAAKLLIENNYSMPKLSDPNYLISTYYIVDSNTSTLPKLFDGEEL